MLHEPTPPEGAAGDGAIAARPAVPPRLDVAAAWAWRLLVLAAAVVALGWVAFRLQVVTLPLVVALLVTSALWPLTAALRRRGWGAAGAATATFLLLLAGLALLLALVVVPAVTQAGDLEDSVRSGAANLPSELGGLGITREDAQRAVDGAADALHDNAREIGSGAFRVALAAASLVGAAIFALVLVFFFLKDGPRLWGSLVRLLPPERRLEIDQDGRAAFASLSGFIRAQALVATVDAIGIGLAVALVGAPLALPIAVLTFVLAFVPVVGAIVSGLVAVLVALGFGGLTDALIVLGAVVLVQQLEGNALFPLLVGRSVSLHPVVVLVALGCGGTLAGVGGAVVAVPVVAAVAGVRTERRSRAIAPRPPVRPLEGPGAPAPAPGAR
ncbi:AI-2E family transporter [Paraconexibacter algicola]|uniref:AI-2E family transporter n=1 Tax=Paraconexibacter algicola TaxID=2133960 RepID=A0A2T4UMK5_9ACTN|nr:AI-2E family transporter [Paraconexibacter algicola]PTL60486.1 AI-2E family transporter [Paraconexibacter algicola]